MSDNGNLEVTPALEWKAVDKVYKLPSGRHARLRRPSPIALVQDSGSIPDTLVSLALRVMSGDKPDPNSLGASELLELTKLAVTFCKAAFVDPRIVDADPVYENGEIRIEDVPPEDLDWVTNWVVNGTEQTPQVQSFRPESDGDVAAAQHGKRVRRKTKHITRD